MNDFYKGTGLGFLAVSTFVSIFTNLLDTLDQRKKRKEKKKNLLTNLVTFLKPVSQQLLSSTCLLATSTVSVLPVKSVLLAAAEQLGNGNTRHSHALF